MLITVFVDLKDIISFAFWGTILVICAVLWILMSVIDYITGKHEDRRRKKMYEEYDRKYGEEEE